MSNSSINLSSIFKFIHFETDFFTLKFIRTKKIFCILISHTIKKNENENEIHAFEHLKKI
jgi:hypothetical protein